MMTVIQDRTLTPSQAYLFMQTTRAPILYDDPQKLIITLEPAVFSLFSEFYKYVI